MIPVIWNKREIYNVCDYYPSYMLGQLSRELADNSRKMMDFKDPTNRKFTIALEHFSRLIAPYLQSIYAQLGTPRLNIVIVPSSTARTLSIGLQSLLEQITSPYITLQRDYLVRQFDVPRAHRGGGRAIEKHLDSIKVGSVAIHNTPVLLLDDVTTSGNSMFACEQILNNAGVLDVYKLAIGKSV